MNIQTVYGEAIEDLLPALIALADAMHVDAEDGMLHSSATLGPKEGLPLQKALMRAEAALMLEDADEIGSVRYEDRSHEQRAYDALMRVIEAVGHVPAIP
jgi:hypothetical protein